MTPGKIITNEIELGVCVVRQSQPFSDNEIVQKKNSHIRLKHSSVRRRRRRRVLLCRVATVIRRATRRQHCAPRGAEDP